MGAAAAAVALAVSLTTSGCSSKKDAEPSATTTRAIDTREIENALLAAQRRFSPDLDVRDPSCPARVVVVEGATFQCTVAVEGVIVPYDVTLKNVDAKLGYDIKPAKALLLMPKLVDGLQRNVPGAKIDCGPDRVKVLDVGSTFNCQVTDPTGNHTVILHVDDVNGNVSQVGGG